MNVDLRKEVLTAAQVDLGVLVVAAVFFADCDEYDCDTFLSNF